MELTIFFAKLLKQINLFLHEKISTHEFVEKYYSLSNNRENYSVLFLSTKELELEDAIYRFEFNSMPDLNERKRGLNSMEAVLKYRAEKLKNFIQRKMDRV